MISRFDRRKLLAGAAGIGAAAALSTKASTTYAAPALIQSGPTEVLYWGSFSGNLGERELELVTKFNEEHTDIQINYQFQGTYEETAQKLNAAIQANQAPDISLLSDVWWFRYYLANAIAPLDDLAAAAGVDFTDYVDSLINEGNRDGAQYWIPFARSTPLFYYNTDAYAEVGLTEAPTNWDQIVEVAPELVRMDGGTMSRSAFAHPDGASYVAWLFQGVTWQWGGEYSDADFNIKINEEGAVAAGEFYRSTVADGWASVAVDPNVDFQNGFTASIMASTGSLAGITANATVPFATAFLPQGPVGGGVCTGGAGLAILNSSEKQEAAFQVVSWMTSPESTAWWSQNTGYMPVRKSAVEGESMQAFFADNPNFKTAVDQLGVTRQQDAARTFIPGGDQIIGGGLEEILINGSDAQSAFDDVAATLTEEAQAVIEALGERRG
jgi:sn-glycerol 3-phosphate transport system substrate-binding protein